MPELQRPLNDPTMLDPQIISNGEGQNQSGQTDEPMNGDMEIDLMIDIDSVDVTPLPEVSERDQKMIDLVRERWGLWYQWYQANHQDRIHDNYNRYNATISPYESIEDIWRGVNGHPIRFAIEYSVAETYKSRLLKAFIGIPEVFKITPENAESIKNAETMNHYVHHVLDLDNYKKTAMFWLDYLARNGSCPWYVFQIQKDATQQEDVQKETPITSSVAPNIQIGATKQTEQQPVRKFKVNRAVWRVYDIETVAFDSSLGEFEKSPWFIIRTIMHRQECMKTWPEYKEYFKSKELEWDGSWDIKGQRESEIGRTQETFQNIKEGKIEVYFYMEPGGTIVVFSNKLIIKSPNPIKDEDDREVFIGMTNLFPIAGEPYGKDPINLSSQFADLWNEIMNIEVDGAKISILPIIKASTDAGAAVDWSSIFFAPGNVWKAADVTQIQMERVPHTVGTSMNLLNAMSEMDQQINGATKTVMGVPSGAEFATEINRMVQESNIRFWLALTSIKLDFIRVIRAVVKHTQAFVAPYVDSQPIIFMVAGENGSYEQIKIDNPAVMQGNFGYHVSLEVDDVDRNLVRAQLLTAVQLVLKSPMLSQATTPQEIFKLMSCMFPGYKEFEVMGGDVQKQLMDILNKLNAEELTTLLGALGNIIEQKTAEEQQGGGKPGAAGAMPGKQNAVPGTMKGAGGPNMRRNKQAGAPVPGQNANNMGGVM